MSKKNTSVKKGQKSMKWSARPKAGSGKGTTNGRPSRCGVPPTKPFVKHVLGIKKEDALRFLCRDYKNNLTWNRLKDVPRKKVLSFLDSFLVAQIIRFEERVVSDETFWRERNTDELPTDHLPVKKVLGCLVDENHIVDLILVEFDTSDHDRDWVSPLLSRCAATIVQFLKSIQNQLSKLTPAETACLEEDKHPNSPEAEENPEKKFSGRKRRN